MLAWLMENMATIIISAVLVLLVAAVIASMVRDKRKGRSSCGCGCAGCAMSGACHRSKPETLRKLIKEGYTIWIYVNTLDKKVERLCCFFKFLILLLLWCYVTNRTVYSFSVIPALYVFKNCPVGLLYRIFGCHVCS